MDDVELIKRLERKAATVLSTRTGVSSDVSALLSEAASALTRLREIEGELAEAREREGCFVTALVSRLGVDAMAQDPYGLALSFIDAATPTVEETLSQRDAAISQRDEAVVRRDELEMFVTNLANADDEQDEWGGRDQFRDWRDKARSLLSERALVSSAATGTTPSPLPPGAEGP